MIIKNLTKNFYINLFIILLIFLIDRITKIYVVSINGKNSYEDLYSSFIFSSKGCPQKSKFCNIW